MSNRSTSVDNQSPSLKSDGVKAYKLKVASFVNAEKLTLLDELAQEWSRVALEAFDWLWQDFLNPAMGLFDMYKARSGPASSFPKTTLVTSQKDLLAVALQGQAKSWVSNLKNRGALIITKHHAKLIDRLSSEAQTEPEDVQATLTRLNQFNHELNWINSMRLWNVPYETQCHLLNESQKSKKTELSSLSLKASLLMHRWFRQYVTHFKLPNPAYLPLQVNVNSSVFTKNEHSLLNTEGYWLRLSTLKGRVELPLMQHSYFDQDKQAPNLTFALLKQDEQWFVIATKKQMKVKAPAPQKSKSKKEQKPAKILGLDLGMKNFIATSKGDLYGQDRLDRLKELDAQIQRCQKGLQNAGELQYGQTKRYRKLISKARNEVTQTVSHCVRSTIGRHRPDVVVVEQLKHLAKDAQLGRQLNRIIRNFGQKAFDQELEKLSKSMNFSIAKVPAAFTSQKCKACGFCLGTNRQGNQFKCMACGYTRHADVQAATNLEKRFSHEADNSLKSANDPLVRATYQLQTLFEWAQRQLARLQKWDSSGLVREHRALGSSKAGLKALFRTKRFRTLEAFNGLSTKNLDNLSKQELMGLLIGSQNQFKRSIELIRVSTR